MAVGTVQTDSPPSSQQWNAALAAGRGFQIHYVSSLDMVAITLGKPRHAYSIEGEEGAVIRVDLETNEVIGIELYDCRERFLPKHPEFLLPYLYASSRWFRISFHIGGWFGRHWPDSRVPVAATARAASPALHPVVP
ncbi:MAG: DUF2283 domain-containing protein [Chloroflexi bacterium]|nr:DUF2283 domain-containing protein [Chloroflexota bacterium]